MADSFQDRIGVFYSGLSKGHKRIADFIKNNYEKASFMTAAKLGKPINELRIAIGSFASHVGFDGYPELQKHLQELVKSHLTSVQRMEVAANRMGGDDIINDAFAADAEMLKRTREGVSREDFFGSVAAINKAHKIYVLGSRSSASLASFAAFYLNYLCDNVVLIDTSSTSEMFEQMFRISEQDVCIAISFPRYSNQTINALSFAKSRGATIISITDGEMSPIAQYATYLLVAESSMVSFVDSLVAPLSLINALIAACAKENDGHVCENLGELEKIWDKYHVYRTDKEEQE